MNERVLMPCRALEAFGPIADPDAVVRQISLNALSGIGGVWTCSGQRGPGGHLLFGLNALSGIGGVWTEMDIPTPEELLNKS